MMEALTPEDPAWVGPYQLLSRLGAGGMGEVYLARRDAAGPGGELAAVKTMLPELGADHGFRTRFRRETAAARAVNSPYTTALLDADPDADPPWLATEYVPGPTLHAAVARGGPLPVPVVRRLGVDLARALAAVHGAGLVHRDVKPGNVLLAAEGPRLIDFGIARAADATALTATGMLVGSPGFMSPEQVRADTAPAAPSDVFCLGAVLCFAATGRSPFHDEETAAVLLRISRAQAELSGVPEELRELLAATLRADPADRPDTAELIDRLTDAPASAAFPWPAPVLDVIQRHAAELARVLAEAPEPPSAQNTVAAPPTPPASGAATAPPAGRRRSRAPLLAVAGAVVAAVGGLLAGALLFGDSGDDDDPAPPSESTDTAGAETEEPVEAALPRSAEFLRSTMVPHPSTGEAQPWIGLPSPTDPELAPDGWAPWWSELGDMPESCSVSTELISCVVPVGTGTGTELRVLNAANGLDITRREWRSTSLAPAVSGGLIYLPDGSDLVQVVAADDTAQAVLAGPSGYDPVRTVVDDGTVYVSYFGDAGLGTSHSMMFRAFGEADGELLWEREITGAFPQTMRLAGGKLFIDADAQASPVLDAATGEPLDEATGVCSLWQLADEWVSCAAGGTQPAGAHAWDASTWQRLDLPPATRPLSTEHGIGLTLTDSDAVAVGLRTGVEQWTAPGEDFYYRSELVAAGDVLLASGLGQVDVYRLSDGALLDPPTLPEGWPGSVRGGTAHDPLPVAHGGVLHLFYQNGSVVSTELPTE
ncbi:protein kinase domain-containing protein [Streptomyces profundus]|uniref:protein kinase domain-containing protein n=1 Tax=Streptomyces profundus TaxID=2867410 RepID=UPI001D16CF69|nr:protein kinase [Streptomyces sp. MA3_2.13]